MHPLEGARAKLRWANKHFESLKAEISDLPAEAKEIGLSQKFDATKGVIRLTISSVPEYPAHWSLIIGDAVQNFRSALNFLTWELAKWNLAKQGLSRDPDGQTQFPIAGKREDFKVYQVKDIHPNHVGVIKDLQPYGSASIERARHHELSFRFPASEEWLGLFASNWHPLAKLQRLSNIDKHESLHPIAVMPDVDSLRPSRYEGSECEILTASIHMTVFEIEATWGEFAVRPTGPDPSVKLIDRFAPEIAFKTSWPVESSLTEISTEVAAILELFEPVFSP